MFVVSDAAPVAGFRPGNYHTLGTDVRLTETGRVEALDGTHLAGSSASMADCMRHLRALELLTEDELWHVGYDNPLALIGASLDPAWLESLPDFTWSDSGV